MLREVIALHTMAVNSAVRLRFNTDDEVQRILVSIYATIIEQVGSIAILAETEKSAGADTILRSALEAYADLKAILRDPDYIHNMNAAFFSEWIRLFKNERSFSMADGVDDIKETLEGYEKALAELKKNNRGPLSNRARFERADLPDQWLVIYNILSSESHNNLRSLIDRHMDASSGTLKINLSKPEKDFTLTLFTSAEILLNSSLDMHTTFTGGDPAVFEPIRAQLVAQRDALSD